MAAATPTLSQYLRASERDREYVEQCESAARTLVNGLIGNVQVDEGLRQQAVLTTGANLYQRRQRLTEQRGSMDGTVQFTPDRPTRDPLDAARFMLATVLGPGIA